MSLRGFATLNIWADDVPAAADWYAEFLGIEPYFSRPGPDGVPAYVEFRIGDSADELGIIDRRYAPPGAPTRTRRGDHALARRRPRGHAAAAARRWAPRSTPPITAAQARAS